jgi:hypothetical protein
VTDKKSNPPVEVATVLAPELIAEIQQVVQSARGQVKRVVNQAMVQAYWEIGRLIVEHEQKGQARAEYGKQQLKQLSQALTGSLGKGFDISNLRRMRAFFQAYPIRDAVRPELSWTHYRALLKVEK